MLSALGIIGEDGSYNPEAAQTITYGDLANPEVIEIISSYAGGLGPWKNNILLREDLEEPVDGDEDGNAEITTQLTGEVFPLVDFAHDAGLQVHPYTLRNEEQFLTLDAEGNPQTPEEEFVQLIEAGVDGFFTDFPATGVAVVDSVTGEFVQSPQNPTLGDGLPNLSGSRGFEGMAFSPDRSTLYPLLEGTVDGDPANSLRIYEFDVESSSFEGLVGYYPTTDGNPIGDFTPINDTEFLVIERDNNEGEEAEFKKIFKIDISQVDENGFVEKTELVDLLNIDDPNDLNSDGETTYSMPFVTIEDVVVVDEDTILVANDNNFPFSMGREGDIDNNEVVLIDLEQPLDLDPNLGGTAITETEEDGTDSELTSVFGTTQNDLLEAGLDFDISNNLIFTGDGDDLIDLSSGEGNNRAYGGDGEDVFILGEEDRIFADGDDDQLYVLSGGNNVITGNLGSDQFWIANGEFPESSNTITDFSSGEDVIGISGLGISFSNLNITQTDAGALITVDGNDLAVVANTPADFLANESHFTFA